MTENLNLIITPASSDEYGIVAEHFYQLWLDNQITPDLIREDWRPITLEFMARAHQGLSFRVFLGRIDSTIVGSVSCQIFAGLYPSPFKPSFRQYGYIWNVYVEPAYRRQGVGSKLTREAVNYLRSLNCTHAILHASPQGKPVYEKFGFIPKNEMILTL
ncbi:MAG: GNAT family N-acetyltransferase [Cyanobacteria bacterium P01_G01_bin.19]